MPRRGFLWGCNAQEAAAAGSRRGLWALGKLTHCLKGYNNTTPPASCLQARESPRSQRIRHLRDTTSHPTQWFRGFQHCALDSSISRCCLISHSRGGMAGISTQHTTTGHHQLTCTSGLVKFRQYRASAVSRSCTRGNRFIVRRLYDEAILQSWAARHKQE